MEIESLKVPDAYVIKPRIFPDGRGIFLETFSQPAFQEAVGYPLTIAQVNCSSSTRGTVRGLHGVVLPPSQARYITCVRGAITDIVVDIRVGSPTFGEHVPVHLDEQSRHALYLAEGLAHGFSPVTEEATVVYLCSTTYNPPGEIRVHPLDPELALPWPVEGEVIMSDKDRAAPSLREAMALGVLPDYADCQAWYAQLRSRSNGALPRELAPQRGGRP
jgi:dTDP-4-dehydrorhamnose 3,5-epimerase